MLKIIKETVVLACSAEHLWVILSDVTRCDWVPTVDAIRLEGSCRVFEMEGMGQVKERILLLDNDAKTLQYSAVETRTPIKHHLATMQVSAVDDDRCRLDWTTEIDPDLFADAVHHGMRVSIAGIVRVVSQSHH